MKRTLNYFGLWSLILLLFVACGDDDEGTPVEPVASFQFEADASNFLQITFTNFSQNAVSSAWDFGDGNVSTEESPVHTYDATGTYNVTLTVVSASGATASKTEEVQVSDPDEKLTLLAGVDSKTWKLVREGTSMLLASDPQYTQIYWPGNSNDGTRPCLYDDEFTFSRDGQYTYNDAGTFWGEFGVFDGTANFEICFDATAANMVNKDGADVSAWLSGTHSYTYDAAADKITLSGEGAWIGIPKLSTSGEVTTPQSGVTFDAIVVDGGASGVDSLFVSFAYDGAFWPFTYVSYENAADEPVLVTEYVEPPCDPLAPVSPTEISHSFASNDAAEWSLMQPIESGAGLALGVDDPTDAAAPKVGKYIRTAGVAYQELQFKLDPANAINFENMTTITMDVYMPSSNTYGDLTDNVFIGFGATTCPPNWWEDLHEYQEMAVAKDQWVTITFQLNAPAYVAVPDNGATVYNRNDLDMIYIAIGGGGHEVGGEFFIRNFSIQ